MNTTTVGLDLSLTGTGAAWADGTLTTITSKPNGDTVKARAQRIADLTNRIVNNITPAALIIIEGPAYSQQAQAGVHLRAGFWWMVANSLSSRGHDIVEVTPSALKKFATGKGNATKPDMRMALYQRAGLDCRDDNQVDAWWLRQVGLHILEDPDRIPLPLTHTTALAKVNRDIPRGIQF